VWLKRAKIKGGEMNLEKNIQNFVLVFVIMSSICFAEEKLNILPLKTYNKEIEFQYPKSWNLETKNDNWYLHSNLKNTFVEIVRKKANQYIDLYDAVNKLQKDESVSKQSIYKVQEFPALKIMSYSNNNKFKSTKTSIYFMAEDSLYIISYISRDDEIEHNEFFNQLKFILDSIKIH